MGYTPEVGADVFLISRKDTEGVGRINFNSKKNQNFTRVEWLEGAKTG
jgi:hypothetical protein